MAFVYIMYALLYYIEFEDRDLSMASWPATKLSIFPKFRLADLIVTIEL